MLSLFSGIGAFEKALERRGVEHEVLAYCEIDKYASKAYSIIHGIPESKNLIDVTKVDILDVDETVDLITYGFPCQDISNAGKQKGFIDEEGNRTRSGLFFEALRIIDDYRPKFAIAENVKALVGKKFASEFKTILESLEEVGYNNYYAVLNAKDYDIPQNRERVFIISIRKNVDRGFIFPAAVPLTLRLKDLLEDEVDEKYYLSDKMFNYAFNMVNEAKGVGFSDGVDRSFINPSIANTIGCRSATDQRSGTTNYVSDRLESDYPVTDLKQAVQNDRMCSAAGVSAKFKDKPQKTFDDHIKQTIDERIEKPCAIDEQNRTVRKDKCVGTLTTDGSSPKKNNRILEQTLRIRKLTPIECYKLMGFDAEDCKKVSAAGVSNAQLYKQAGNSIVVNVVEAIFTELGKTYEEFKVSEVVGK